jgi:hypothetical protein
MDVRQGKELEVFALEVEEDVVEEHEGEEEKKRDVPSGVPK